jgi:hypothetical protein
MANTPFPPFYLGSFPLHELRTLRIDCDFNRQNREGCDAKREVTDEPCPGNSSTLTRDKNVGRAIAKSLSLSTSTISKYLKQLEPVPWPLPDPGGEALLAQVLKKKTPTPSSRTLPDWDQIHRELQSHKGVTLLLLWEEYRATTKERGYSYSRFCVH